MDARQIRLVQSTFAQLEPDAEPLADLLYARLFQLDPSMRALFPPDLQQKKDKFICLLALVVNHLNHPETWLPRVEQLGRQHRACGIEARHYETFGSALIWTLDKALGEEFSFQVLDAWVAFYTLLAQTLTAAGNVQEED